MKPIYSIWLQKQFSTPIASKAPLAPGLFRLLRTMRRHPLPAVAMLSQFRLRRLQNGAVICSESIRNSQTALSGERRLFSLMVGRSVTSHLASSAKSLPCPSCSTTPTSASGRERTTRFVTLRQRLRLWPLDEIEKCPVCGLAACWIVQGIRFCISPACDPEGATFAFLDKIFKAQK